MKDVRELYALEQSVFSKDDFSLSLHSFYYHLKRNKLFVLKEGSRIVAYILWLKRKKYYRLYSLCVDKNFRGEGKAAALLEYSIKKLDCPKYTLEVRTDNTPAVFLYEKFGFEAIKILKEFYPDKKDAYLMEKNQNGE